MDDLPTAFSQPQLNSLQPQQQQPLQQFPSGISMSNNASVMSMPSLQPTAVRPHAPANPMAMHQQNMHMMSMQNAPIQTGNPALNSQTNFMRPQMQQQQPHPNMFALSPNQMPTQAAPAVMPNMMNNQMQSMQPVAPQAMSTTNPMMTKQPDLLGSGLPLNMTPAAPQNLNIQPQPAVIIRYCIKLLLLLLTMLNYVFFAQN